MTKKEVVKRISEIRKRLEDHNEHEHDAYSYDPREINQVRDFHTHAVNDITFLLDQIK